MGDDHGEERIEPTLGDLIVAVNDTAFELCGEKRGSYLFASLVLEQIFKRGALRTDTVGEISGAGSPEWTPIQ